MGKSPRRQWRTVLSISRIFDIPNIAKREVPRPHPGKEKRGLTREAFCDDNKVKCS
jgi:hypothetical protein